MGTVCIKEGSRNIDDLSASPFQYQSWLLCYDCYGNCLQILFSRIAKELLDLIWRYHNCHSFLGFRNGKLCSVQSGIFLRYFIKIYHKTVSQFTDGDRNTACTKVITFLNDTAYFPTTEQPLDLTLCRCVSLLYLCTAGLNGGFCMHLGGTGCTTAAVTSCSSAKQDDHIIRIRIFTYHILPGSSTHDSTDLHSFSNIIRMIDLLYIAGCKTDLVTIGRISACCTSDQLLL